MPFKSVMRRLPISCLSASALALAVSMSAQAGTIDLMQSYELALQQDKGLATAHASLLASEENPNQTRAQLLPSLSVGANTAFNKTSNGRNGQGDLNDDYNSNGWSATLRQPVFNLNRWFSHEQTKFLTEAARTNFAKEQQAVILRVSEAYFAILRAEDKLSTAVAQEEAFKTQLDQTRQRFEVGLIAETDVLEAQAAYDDARVTRILAKNSLTVASENLRVIINQPVDDVASLNKDMPVNAPVPSSAEAWVDSAVKGNLTLKASRQNITAAESALRTAKSGHLPTVDAVASYSSSSSNADSARSGAFDGDNSQTAFKLELNLPIYSGGATSSKVRQAGFQLQQAQETSDNTLRRVAADTRSLYQTVTADIDRVEARMLGIKSNESALEAVKAGYEVGTRTVVDVLNAQRNLFAARQDYLDARYDFIINTLKLKQAAGSLDESDLQVLNKWVSAEA
ncbi:TolC family outer membrane protein [Endozoicomonadaceae bacterium StTr2]